VAMLLAGAYAVESHARHAGLSVGESRLSIPWMIRYHATINVFGFAAPGLLAWLVFPGGKGETRADSHQAV
jgi:hypothetical protein